MFSAKRLDVLCVINKENFSLPLINIMWLRSRILSVLWQEIVKRTSFQIKLLRISEQKLATEATAEVWSRDEQ